MHELTETWCRNTNFTVDIQDLQYLGYALVYTSIGPHFTAATLIHKVTVILDPDVWKTLGCLWRLDLDYLFALRLYSTISFLLIDNSLRSHHLMDSTGRCVQNLSAMFLTVAQLRECGYTVKINVLYPEVDLSEVELVEVHGFARFSKRRIE